VSLQCTSRARLHMPALCHASIRLIVLMPGRHGAQFTEQTQLYVHYSDSCQTGTAKE
jgi:hypothetical protein